MSKVNRFSLEERYGYQNRKVIYDKDADNDIELNSIYPIIDLLNKYDKQIAELEKQLAEKAKTIQGLVETQKYLEESASYQIFLDIQKENILLKMQLKSQPAEIVEKIKKQIFNHFNVKNIEEYERLSLLDSLFTADAVTDMLDDILKEYQKTNNL